ncbi:MAG: hypothetical protein IT584_01850 [Chlamydiae bacterium]|nr:hypothetical protein [Chlamydiota bacterium]
MSIGAEPNRNLSDLQLAAYEKGDKIPREWNAESLKETMDNLSLSEVTPEALYDVMILMAENDLTSFFSAARV